jgi:hypothetical protein
MSAQENEKEAVRTTIVGGRPPGNGRSTGAVPRGIEVLVKKAAVDLEFRELLLEQRGGAAAAIGLELDPAEAAMLSAIPREQLIFPGFYHFNLEENVLPKLELLRRFGFYLDPERAADPNAESCGAHSPRVI